MSLLRMVFLIDLLPVHRVGTSFRSSPTALPLRVKTQRRIALFEQRFRVSAPYAIRPLLRRCSAITSAFVPEAMPPASQQVERCRILIAAS
jgi:hypothetical protein